MHKPINNEHSNGDITEIFLISAVLESAMKKLDLTSHFTKSLQETPSVWYTFLHENRANKIITVQNRWNLGIT